MMWIALVVVIAAVVFVAGAAIFQYVRPPQGPAVVRHEMTPFEAQSAAEQGSKLPGMAGGGPGGTWRNKSGNSWKDKTSSV